MTWLKTAIDDLYNLLIGLPIKVRCFYMGMIIVFITGVFVFKEYNKTQIELARIEHATPQKNNDKSLDDSKGLIVKRIYPKDGVSLAGAGQ